MRAFFFALLIAPLAGCLYLPNKLPITTGGQETTKGWQQILEDRKAWSQSSFEVAKSSKANANLRHLTLDIIADGHIRKPVPICKDLRLLTVILNGMSPIELKQPDGSIKEYRPLTYHESWTVNACGQVVEWLVFDHEGGMTAIPSGPTTDPAKVALATNSPRV